MSANARTFNPSGSSVCQAIKAPAHQRRRLACCSMVQASYQVHSDIAEVLLTKEAIAQRVDAVARQIASDYADKQPVVVGTLKGAVLFMADLVRAMDPPPEGLQLEFVRASSYGAATVSSGKVAVSSVGGLDIQGRHVLLVEDIVDTGRTAAALVERFRADGAASVSLVSLLSKPARRVIQCKPEYTCFEIEDKFVVGYGLDFNEQYRSLPYIGVLKPACYSSEASD